MTSDNNADSPQTGLPLRRIAREWALQYLYQLDISGEEMSDRSLAWMWKQVAEEQPDLGDREIRKCQANALTTISGVLEHKEEIDQKINEQAQNWNMDRMATVDRNILRVAVFEICYVDDVPAPVSIDEALEICRTYGGGEESRGFINGILDKIYQQCRTSGESS